MLAVFSCCNHLKYFLVSLKLFSYLLWRFQLDYVSTFHLSQILLPDILQIYTLFTNWNCTHICISYTFLTIFCPVCITLFAHMVSELTVSHRNKEFVCFFIGRTTSPAPSTPQLSTVLPIILRPHDFSPSHFFCLLLSSLFILHLDSYVD